MAHETIESSQPSTRSVLFLQKDGEWWDAGMLIALVIAGLVALIVALFTFGSIKAHKREAAVSDKELADYKRAADRRITDAREEIAKAQARAAEANARAEEARNTASQANLKLEQTRLKLNEIQAVVPYEDRILKDLIHNLSKIKIKSEYLWSVYESNNNEAQFKAYQLSDVFKIAGFKNALGGGVDNEMREKGDKGDIVVINHDDSTDVEAKEIFEAFKSAGFKVSARRAQKNDTAMIADVEKPFIYVLVLKREFRKF